MRRTAKKPSATPAVRFGAAPRHSVPWAHVEGGAPEAAAPDAAPLPAFRFGKIPIQAELEVGPVGDPLEREADATANRVMRMPDPEAKAGGKPDEDEKELQREKLEQQNPGAAGTVQRKCEACAEEGGKLQRKPAQGAVAEKAAPAIVHDVLRSPGQPLDAGTRAFMEPRFGRDFGGVRVHTDAQAAASAAAVGARAYTVGRDVVLGAGRHAPASSEGRRLLAHELSHVVQQGAARPGAGEGRGASLQRESEPSPSPATLVLGPAEDGSANNPRLAAFAAAARQQIAAAPGKKVIVSTAWGSPSPTGAEHEQASRDAVVTARQRGDAVAAALIRLGVPADAVSASTRFLGQETSPGAVEGQVDLDVISPVPVPVIPGGALGDDHAPDAKPKTKPAAATGVDLGKSSTFQFAMGGSTFVIKLVLPYVPIPKTLELKNKLLSATGTVPTGATLKLMPVRGIPGLSIAASGQLDLAALLKGTPAPSVTPSGAVQPSPGPPLKLSMSVGVDGKGFKIEGSVVADLSQRTVSIGPSISLIESGVKYQVPSSVFDDLQRGGAKFQAAMNSLMGYTDQMVGTAPVGPPPPTPAGPSGSPAGDLAAAVDGLSTIVDAMDKINKAKQQPTHPTLKIGPTITLPYGTPSVPTPQNPGAGKPVFGVGVTYTFP